MELLDLTSSFEVLEHATNGCIGKAYGDGMKCPGLEVCMSL